jgi:dienelactone hydrolase
MKGAAVALVTILAFATLTLAAAGSEESRLTFQTAGQAFDIPATLIKPAGDGPFPAVVIMHDCSGLGRRSSGAPSRWARELVRQGYVAMIPDSFTPRGLPDGVCTATPEQGSIANASIRTRDAYGALAALRKLPYVDGAHVGIMGGSHGGWTTLEAMVEPKDGKDELWEAKRNGFAAAIALYPVCGGNFGEWSVVRQNRSYGPVVFHSGVYKPIAPLLILIGKKDDWTPAKDCQQLVDVSRSAGYPMSIITYEGAHHSFDSTHPVQYDPRRSNTNSPTRKGATTGGDPTAWADARKQAASFFRQYLKQ